MVPISLFKKNCGTLNYETYYHFLYTEQSKKFNISSRLQAMVNLVLLCWELIN